MRVWNQARNNRADRLHHADKIVIAVDVLTLQVVFTTRFGHFTAGANLGLSFTVRALHSHDFRHSQLLIGGKKQRMSFRSSA